MADNTPAITRARVTQLLDNKNVRYDTSEDNPNLIVTAFSSFGTIIDPATLSPFLTVSMASSNKMLPAEALSSLAAWANKWNASTVYGMAFPDQLDSGHIFARVECNLEVRHGLTDEQLEEFLMTALAACLESMEDYVATFDPQLIAAP
ncbi:YbjN domain-containing protein [Corynebacterium aquilae]|uniref:YbjN domain-containing protein n=1 Tax=Corynebacterium aquilae DSM 44791 TaxID=1431546 RepID=A0A1L7CGX8_9CORY|nr:YbjN domain-containing protein [Corynebacterium aquilae]APT85108.1 hypothetical protein CAQU_08535 [Corynebacterium aquilae DSM 44791]